MTTLISPQLPFDLFTKIYNSKVHNQTNVTISPIFYVECAQEKVTTHFSISNPANIPFSEADNLIFFPEQYYDTENFLLLKNKCWLRKVGAIWSLKQVHCRVEECGNENNYKILYYEEHSERTIFQHLENTLNVVKKDLRCFAEFSVFRYLWKEDITVDICTFGKNCYYFVGTFDLKNQGKINIEGGTDANAKIVEYILHFKTPLVQYIQSPKPLPPTKLYLANFTLPTVKKLKEKHQKEQMRIDYLYSKISEEDEKNNR